MQVTEALRLLENASVDKGTYDVLKPGVMYTEDFQAETGFSYEEVVYLIKDKYIKVVEVFIRDKDDNGNPVNGKWVSVVMLGDQSDEALETDHTTFY